MSEVSDAARVQLVLADYAAGDSTNKINALGVGFQLAVLQPTGTTSPHTVAVLVDVPARFVGGDMAFELALRDDAGQVVMSPGAPGQDATAIRFAQAVVLQDPTSGLNLTFPRLRIPRNALWCRHQMVATFANGVAVHAGRGYEWRVSIDGTTRPDWAVGFYVPAPAGGVVVG